MHASMRHAAQLSQPHPWSGPRCTGWMSLGLTGCKTSGGIAAAHMSSSRYLRTHGRPSAHWVAHTSVSCCIHSCTHGLDRQPTDVSASNPTAGGADPCVPHVEGGSNGGTDNGLEHGSCEPAQHKQAHASCQLPPPNALQTVSDPVDHQVAAWFKQELVPVHNTPPPLTIQRPLHAALGEAVATTCGRV